jgi:lipoprotein-releasing system permease protein
VASTLMVLVRERLRDVGVLVALGLERWRVASVFVGYGLAVGAAGCLLGLAIGAVVSWFLTTFEVIRFDPEVASIYFLEAVPFRVTLADLATIGGYSLVVTLLSSLLPAWLAGRIDPAAALRYE